MKYFLKNCLLFGLCMLTAGFAIELYLLGVSNEYAYKRKYVESCGEKIKILTLGHSHAANGIDPRCLGDSAFNMATSGRNVYYDAVLLKRYAPRLNNLACVIWPLGYNFQYESYRFPLPQPANSKRSVHFSSYRCMFEKYMDIPYDRQLPYLYWSELINSNFNYGQRIFTKDFETLHQCDSLGQERLTVAQKSLYWQMDVLPEKIDYNHPNAKKAFHQNLSYMRQIAETCRDRQVRLLVVTFPCYSTYTERVTPRGMREMYACVDSMKAVYPELEYYNYMADPRFVDDDFYNASHLTDQGAEKITGILRRIIEAGGQ